LQWGTIIRIHDTTDDLPKSMVTSVCCIPPCPEGAEAQGFNPIWKSKASYLG
jgi:hypothetical protein